MDILQTCVRREGAISTAKQVDIQNCCLVYTRPAKFFVVEECEHHIRQNFDRWEEEEGYLPADTIRINVLTRERIVEERLGRGKVRTTKEFNDSVGDIETITGLGRDKCLIGELFQY